MNRDIIALDYAAGILGVPTDELPNDVKKAVTDVCELCSRIDGTISSRQIVATIIYDLMERRQLNDKIEYLEFKLNGE